MAQVEDSILQEVKKLIGFEYDYTQFDMDFIIHINAALSTLHQLGVGPLAGFKIEDETSTWAQLALDTVLLGMIKDFIFYKVKLVFDTPSTSFAIGAFEKQIEELAFRIKIQAEGVTT